MVNDNFISIGDAASGVKSALGKHFLVVSTQIITCEKHGDFKQETFASGRKSICPDCMNDRAAEEQAKRNADNQAKRERILEARIGKACIPLRYRNKTISAYEVVSDEQKQIAGKLKEYALEFNDGHSGRNIAMLGNKGTGKTHLACAIASHVIKNLGGSARFTSVSELSRIVRESKSFDSEYNESQIISDFSSYDFLVIDEVGIQSGTDAESRALFDVFNARYENMKPTAFISNLEFQEFKAALGERIIDRLREDGGEILMFNWGTHRK